MGTLGAPSMTTVGGNFSSSYRSTPVFAAIGTDTSSATDKQAKMHLLDPNSYDRNGNIVPGLSKAIASGTNVQATYGSKLIKSYQARAGATKRNAAFNGTRTTQKRTASKTASIGDAANYSKSARAAVFKVKPKPRPKPNPGDPVDTTPPPRGVDDPDYVPPAKQPGDPDYVPPASAPPDYLDPDFVPGTGWKPGTGPSTIPAEIGVPFKGTVADIPGNTRPGPMTSDGKETVVDSAGNTYGIDDDGFAYVKYKADDQVYPLVEAVPIGNVPDGTIPVGGDAYDVNNIPADPPPNQTIAQNAPGWKRNYDSIVNTASLIVGVGTIPTFIIPYVTADDEEAPTDTGTGTDPGVGVDGIPDDGGYDDDGDGKADRCDPGYKLTTVNGRPICRWTGDPADGTPNEDGDGIVDEDDEDGGEDGGNATTDPTTTTTECVRCCGIDYEEEEEVDPDEKAELECYMGCLANFTHQFEYTTTENNTVWSEQSYPIPITSTVYSVCTIDGKVAYTYNSEPKNVKFNGKTQSYKEWAIAEDLKNPLACPEIKTTRGRSSSCVATRGGSCCGSCSSLKKKRKRGGSVSSMSRGSCSSKRSKSSRRSKSSKRSKSSRRSKSSKRSTSSKKRSKRPKTVICKPKKRKPSVKRDSAYYYAKAQAYEQKRNKGCPPAPYGQSFGYSQPPPRFPQVQPAQGSFNPYQQQRFY